MSEFVRHICFNPQMTWSLDKICTDQQAEGYALLRVVPSHAYESVAVFEYVARPAREADDAG